MKQLSSGAAITTFAILGFLMFTVWSYWSKICEVRVDEMLHLHDTWLISQGSLPYRDFFEHHACWYHFIMSPLASHYDPASSSKTALEFISIARKTSLWLTLSGLALVVWIGKLWRDWPTGIMAAVLLSGVPFFLETAIEIRPDVPAFVLWMGSLVLIGRQLKTGASSTRDIQWSIFSGGVLLGAAIMFTQKMLFGVPGLAATLGLWVTTKRDTSFAARLHLVWQFALGLFLPTFFTWIYFLSHGAGFEFIDKVFLINARWAFRESPWILLEWFWHDSGIFLILFGVAMILAVLKTITLRRIDWLEFLFFSIIAGWFIGLFWIIPVVDRQFYMIMLPPMALVTAYALRQASTFWPRCLQPVFWIGIFWFTTAEPLSTSQKRLTSIRGISPSLDLALWVIDQTPRTATVLDGWTGVGVFRPQAWYYGFIHREIPLIINEHERAALIQDLRSGRRQPSIIVQDDKLLNLHSELTPWVQQHYRLIPDRRLWARRIPNSQPVGANQTTRPQNPQPPQNSDP